MKKISIWLIFSILSIGIFISIFLSPVINYGGDIAEYHGITETIIRSGEISLTPIAKYNLQNYLQPSYFDDNPSYYIEGVDGKRYPVHFIFYSILAVPIRLALHLLSINELQTLRITNYIILTTTIFLLLKYFFTTFHKRIILLTSILLSPLIFFITWPGPDLFYLCILIFSVIYFLRKRFLVSAALTALASWHSQPLIIMSILIGVYAIFDYTKRVNISIDYKKHIEFALKLGIIPTTIFIPIFYNLLFFGALTPWTKIKDGWTIIHGFGIQNISIWKFFEQLFDLNTGIFIYAPIMTIVGIFFIIKNIKTRTVTLIALFFLITAFFYQTNPAWHYGTAGFGPGRHTIFLLPLFIVIFVKFIKFDKFGYLILGLYAILQLFILSMNGYTNPYLPNTLEHNPIAKFVLNNWPALYSPTPEIFVDRTTHNDLSYPGSAIYKYNNECKKAYITKTSIPELEKECGPLSSNLKEKLDNNFLRKSNVSRKTMTNQATFWPDTLSCSDEYLGPYICMDTLDEFIKQTGFENKDRIENLSSGIWKIKFGDPTEITIPPGYIIHHYSFEGIYVNF